MNVVICTYSLVSFEKCAKSYLGRNKDSIVHWANGVHELELLLIKGTSVLFILDKVFPEARLESVIRSDKIKMKPACVIIQKNLAGEHIKKIFDDAGWPTTLSEVLSE